MQGRTRLKGWLRSEAGRREQSALRGSEHRNGRHFTIWTTKKCCRRTNRASPRRAVVQLSDRNDYNFADETSSQLFFSMLGTPDADKRRIIYDTRQNLPPTDAM